MGLDINKILADDFIIIILIIIVLYMTKPKIRDTINDLFENINSIFNKNG